METWTDRDSIVLKDQKDKKEGKWSHFNKCLEALLKDSRFRARTVYEDNYRDRSFDSYFKGRR